MSYKVHDYICTQCAFEYEDIVDSLDRTSPCPQCSTKNSPVLSATPLASYSMMEPAQKAAHMKDRSARHTQKEINKTPEKWGAAGKERATRRKYVKGGI